MADANPTVWDGKFLQFMPRADAIIARDAGLVQIFEGPTGYDPGFVMKDGSEFPFTPVVVLAPLVVPTPPAPPVVVDEDEDEDN